MFITFILSSDIALKKNIIKSLDLGFKRLWRMEYTNVFMFLQTVRIRILIKLDFYLSFDVYYFYTTIGRSY